MSINVSKVNHPLITKVQIIYRIYLNKFSLKCYSCRFVLATALSFLSAMEVEMEEVVLEMVVVTAAVAVVVVVDVVVMVVSNGGTSVADVGNRCYQGLC